MRYQSLPLAFAAALAVLPGCSRTPAPPAQRTFPSPDAAVEALIEAADAETTDDLIAIFGPEGRELLASSDPVTARRNREVFSVAVAERWELVDEPGTGRTLVIGNEEWPFPVPLVKAGDAWRFDTAAGREEVIARRIGRNELAAIRICRTYVVAQRLYAARGHDGAPPGLFARTFRSDPGRQNGLYWPARRGERRSPLGDLMANAAQERQPAAAAGAQPSPFHGYYFKILTGQGPSAPGGAKDYVVAGKLSGGFALVAWPAQYDVTGVMTFVVNHDGIVWEKDLGPDTAHAAQAVTLYDPDASWTAIR